MRSRLGTSAFLWILVVAVLGYLCITTLRIETELSLLLPEGRTPKQQFILEAMREGPASRLILIALENASPDILAAASRAFALQLRKSSDFIQINNGEPVTPRNQDDLLFQYRYLLSSKVQKTRFSAQGLHDALANRLRE
ncbi:MAG: hypothetical protein R3351_09205, partial [Nitrospirales bacterium]|nr:hypothetical protein [Nitrospirales bacterium]